LVSSSLAVTNASRLDEIKFPEFTAKLITDTFDALIAANIRQTEAYTELLKAVRQDVQEYVNNTKDEISGEMVLQFLSKTLSNPEVIQAGKALSSEDADTLKEAIEGEGVTEEELNAIKPSTSLDKAGVDKIISAIASRIAADKYSFLKQMVAMGVLRLVIETGVIETKLTFKTYASENYANNSSKYNSSAFAVSAKAETGGLVSAWVKASAATSYSTFSVSTANSSNTSGSEASAEIFGRVQINFKTDYQPLSTA